MHPILDDHLAYTLPGRQSESSFPERHIWVEADDIGNKSHDVAYEQPGFPKLDFGPGLSSLWQQSWLDANQTIHRHHLPTVDRITSPQDHNPPHDLFISSPVRGPSHHDPGWDLLRTTALPTPDFSWLPSQHQQQHSPKIKVEDDSDSNWSLNDNSSEDLQLPQLIRPQIQGPRRRAGAGTGRTRVSKVARPPPTPTYQHTFRMSKVPVETIDLSGAGPGAGESPDDFAAKMLERRIAHKLSEKSRRNRLTAAIREIQKLMPAEQACEAAGGASTGEAAAGLYPHFSKVDVAEMTIGYIKKLQKENQELRKQNQELKEKEKQPDKADSEHVEEAEKP